MTNVSSRTTGQRIMESYRGNDERVCCCVDDIAEAIDQALAVRDNEWQLHWKAISPHGPEDIERVMQTTIEIAKAEQRTRDIQLAQTTVMRAESLPGAENYAAYCGPLRGAIAAAIHDQTNNAERLAAIVAGQTKAEQT